MRIALGLMMIVLFSGVTVADTPFAEVTISRSEWQRPRSGEHFLAQPGLQRLMQRLSREKGVLAIRHPGGDEGVMWAEELRGWLVALGLSSARIVLVPSGGDAAMITLQLNASADPPS
ncbi:MAG: hypothetical protein HQL48_07760 [Gammaproteobacteria bacterium]|nr:hypothetical protein [Gammaproteobacteria bacterium]